MKHEPPVKHIGQPYEMLNSHFGRFIFKEDRQ